MASSLDFVEYIYEQISDIGDISYRKMFGEYVIYCNGKVFGGIYDNRFLIKITDAGKKIMKNPQKQLPYEGAKLMYLVEDLDNKEFLKELILETCKQLPTPKPKKSKL